MPFRTNFFQELIAQPDTSLGDIEYALIERHGFDTVEIALADLFTTGDDEFKFGGTLHFTASTEDDEGGEPDYHDASMEFDGFDSLDDAKAWVLGMFPSVTITEVD